MRGSGIELGHLAQVLIPVVQRQPAGLRRVFLRINPRLPWQKVVDVLDQIRLASEEARRRTAAQTEPSGQDGGDIKVVMVLNWATAGNLVRQGVPVAAQVRRDEPAEGRG